MRTELFPYLLALSEVVLRLWTPRLWQWSSFTSRPSVSRQQRGRCGEFYAITSCSSTGLAETRDSDGEQKIAAISLARYFCQMERLGRKKRELSAEESRPATTHLDGLNLAAYAAGPGGRQPPRWIFAPLDATAGGGAQQRQCRWLYLRDCSGSGAGRGNDGEYDETTVPILDIITISR
jgi:hypothetical protein